MKFENNWRQKSIENLEKDNWGPVPEDESSIVIRLMKLRKTPLEQFVLDDIRFMLIQEIGLFYLLPMAIEILEKDLLAEGNYYPGDLLNAVMKLKPENWKPYKAYWLKIDTLLQDRLEELKKQTPRIDLENFYGVTFS